MVAPSLIRDIDTCTMFEVSCQREGGLISYRPLLKMQVSKKEKRGVIRFLAAEGVGGREMHRQMKAVYSEYSQCRSNVVEWRYIFPEGRELLEDEARLGQAHCVITRNNCESECFSFGQSP
ncbi:histone-lysine N-methyltransferase SETMAR [Trichonephila clavata]|uniref:Histone-lysine N-methyltransferase SETMAR n=1 Tax=Trichonephila clavata TaxID=2740835 RepID=A0A8X6KY81_TRICU|nr:histone-lysine N-methyltransferase SETMAR [Trichonephila clavata]